MYLSPPGSNTCTDGDNLRHGQCTDGKFKHGWSGNCSKPSSGRGGGVTQVESCGRADLLP